MSKNKNKNKSMNKSIFIKKSTNVVDLFISEVFACKAKSFYVERKSVYRKSFSKERLLVDVCIKRSLFPKGKHY